MPANASEENENDFRLPTKTLLVGFEQLVSSASQIDIAVGWVGPPTSTRTPNASAADRATPENDTARLTTAGAGNGFGHAAGHASGEQRLSPKLALV
jgi:hypothetical protein